MAPATNTPLQVDGRATARIWLYGLGAVVLLAAFVAPWWTRGISVDTDKLYAEDFEPEGDSWFSTPPGTEGIYWNYGPFSTPSTNGDASGSFDASRSAVVTLLGIAMAGCTLLLVLGLAVRALRATGRIEASPNLPVALSIGAFAFGLAAVLIGALFVPLMGSNPGWLYGDEEPESAASDTDGLNESTRYANVGFFAGIVALVLLPAYAWFDAARSRHDEVLGTTQGTTATSGATGAVADSLAKPRRKPTPSLE